MARIGDDEGTVPGSGSGVESLAEGVISDLIRVGLISVEPGAARQEMFKPAEALNLFLPLLTRFDVRLRPMTRPDCPVRFCTGILKMEELPTGNSRGACRAIPGGGQGLVARNAALSCVGELAERVSLCSLGPDDPRVFPKIVGQPEVDFLRLMGVDATQGQVVAAGGEVAAPQMPISAGELSALSGRRVSIRSVISGEVSQLPSFSVLFEEEEQVAGAPLGYASSTGCAVWPSLEGARARALLELAERDAVAQMWYNRLGITRIEKDRLQELMPSELFIYLVGQPRDWGVYVLETDLAVQVAMAVSFEPGGLGCAFGSSAGWDLASACTAALEEMLQSENSLALMEKAYPDLGTDAEMREPRQLAYARRRSILDDLPLETAMTARDGALNDTFSYDDLLRSCADAKIDIWEFEATRPDLGIPCIKLLSADLCTWEPRFGRPRLFQGVVNRGLRASPASVEEFAARPFPF